MGAARAVGRAPRQRPSGTPRRVHVQRALRRAVARPAGCCWPATRPTRCRRSPGRACAPASATPPTWPGSSTSSSTATPPSHCSTRTRLERLPSARQAIELSMGLGNVICVPDVAAAAARDDAMVAAVGAEPAGDPGPARPGCRARPPELAVGRAPVRPGRRRGSAVRRRARRRLATRDARRRSSPRRRHGRVVRGRSAVASSPIAEPGAVHARWFAEHETSLGTATTGLPPLRHRDERRRRHPAARRPPSPPRPPRPRPRRDSVMKIATCNGRAAIVLGDEIADIATVSGGRFGPDPMSALCGVGRVHRARRDGHHRHRSAHRGASSATRCRHLGRSSPSGSTTAATPRSPA